MTLPSTLAAGEKPPGAAEWRQQQNVTATASRPMNTPLVAQARSFNPRDPLLLPYQRVCLRSTGTVSALERHGELELTAEAREKLLTMSAATIDRLLATRRRRLLHTAHGADASPTRASAASSSLKKGRRVIAIDPGTVEVLKAQAARQLDEQKDWDEAWVETGLVFTLENGAALDPESVSRYFRLAVKMSMLPQIRLHDLRHTHATLALQAGIHPKVVSERLGHATISITLDTYSHAIPAMQEEAAALIAGLVFASQ
jgi:Phage integrase family